MSLFKKIVSVFVEDETTKMYKEREKRLKEKYSDENAYEQVIEDALKSTGKELVENKNYTPKKASDTLEKKVVKPLKIKFTIFTRVKYWLIDTFTGEI